MPRHRFIYTTIKRHLNNDIYLIALKYDWVNENVAKEECPLLH